MGRRWEEMWGREESRHGRGAGQRCGAEVWGGVGGCEAEMWGDVGGQRVEMAAGGRLGGGAG